MLISNYVKEKIGLGISSSCNCLSAFLSSALIISLEIDFSTIEGGESVNDNLIVIQKLEKERKEN